jgi:beta-galactosidase
MKINVNKDWYFLLGKDFDTYISYGFSKYAEASGPLCRYYDYPNWERIDLPHDWVIKLPKDLNCSTFTGARAKSRFNRYSTNKVNSVEKIHNIGWYRKHFIADKEWEGKHVFIEFEGVFRDSKIFVNGEYLTTHESGYTSIILELTDHLLYGRENSIALRVDCEQPEGWWYEGGGIYRNVFIHVKEPTYFKFNKTQIKTSLDGKVSVNAVVVNDTDCSKKVDTVWAFYDKNGQEVAKTVTQTMLEPYQENKISCSVKIDNPLLWDLENPNLYTLKIKIGDEETSERFGIRSVAFDANEGFLLNGKPVKVRGACVHQDFGGVGIALSDNLQYYKIKKLKEMGCNAYRSAHHAPSPTLLNACDELGMLFMDETRIFSPSPEGVKQLTDLIERDRNHPCVFIWSLGNEEFSIQNDKQSAIIMEKITRIAKSLDDRPVTYGGTSGTTTGVNGVSEVRGVNYIRNQGKKDGFLNWLDRYHYDYPNTPIIGTEEGSHVESRGGAINDLGSGLIDSTGNVTMPWGSTPKGWVKFMEERPYFSGSFMWTGFDYHGETNPFYHSNVSSSFGTIDICGMEKPPFYYYKSWWTDGVVLKLTPHWNFNKGDKVTVAVFTNCEEITLVLNGNKIETRKIEKYDQALFSLDFEPGILEVIGTKNGNTYTDKLVTSGKTASVIVTEIEPITKSGDIAIYEINAYDENGIYNPTASENVELEIKGGEIVGVGNGDPADLSYEQQENREECEIIRTFNYEHGLYMVDKKVPNKLMTRYYYFDKEDEKEGFEDDYRLIANYKDHLRPIKTYTFTRTLTNVSNYEYIEFECLLGRAKVYLNGEFIGDNLRTFGLISASNKRPYRFYCNFKDGDNELKIEFEIFEEDGEPISGYVKAGRTVKPNDWSVKLHYGKARVFVKSETPEKVVLNVKIKK